MHCGVCVMKFFERTYDSFDRIIGRLKHPVLIILLIGLIVRLLFIPLSVSDSQFWFKTSENIASGFGLYGRAGFYYSPPFGYIFGIVTVLGNVLLSIPVFASFSDPMIGLTQFYPFTTVITSIGYNAMYKIPLIIGDVLVSALLYWFIMRMTGDKTKAILAFALWFLSPLVIFESSIHGMVDVYSALLSLLCVAFLFKDRYFFAGLALGGAFFVKMFPAVLLPLAVVYIIHKCRGDRMAAFKNIMVAAIGAILAFIIIYIPIFMDGSFIESWGFMTNRASGVGSLSSGGKAVVDSIRDLGNMAGFIALAVACLISIYLSHLYYKNQSEDRERLLLSMAVVVIGISFLWVPMPQYLVLLVPFVIIAAVMYDRRLITSVILMSIGGVVMILMVEGPSALFLSLGVHTGIVDLDSVINSILAYVDTPRSGQYSYLQMLFVGLGAFIQGVGVFIAIARNSFVFRRGANEEV
jgi:Predicted membrane-bound dolichyl-phosphate-mannose-protein mannosyltransferase